MKNPIVISIYTLSFFMSFAVGANDAANSLGTLYGSKAMKLVYIIVIGAIFEFIGAVWCSGHIANGLVAKIIVDIDDEHISYQTRMMLGASISSFLFIMTSSVFGMPISGTHAVIGGLVGAGLVGCGFDSIGWLQLLRIVGSWFLSPVLSLGLCFVLMVIVSSLTMGGLDFSFKIKILALTLLTASCLLLTTFMFI